MEVWKYVVDVVDYQLVLMPKGARLLHVGEQHAAIALWVLVDPEAEKAQRHILIRGTGHGITPPAPDYVGTVIAAGGSLVWHVFDRGEADE